VVGEKTEKLCDGRQSWGENGEFVRTVAGASRCGIVSGETARFFQFSIMIEPACRYATDAYPQVCKAPETVAEVNECMRYYAISGFPGCIGSVDVTHIKWCKCTGNLKQIHKSRYGYTTRAYQVTVNHKKQCLAATSGFYGTCNDKTIIKFDEFVQRVQSLRRYTEQSFDLFDLNGMVHQHKGVYLLSDNGYHKWRILQMPEKRVADTASMYYLKWSKRLESLRKDVECFFGALKVRFLILNGHIRVQKIKTVDNIFFTCCALHNQLLEWDELDNWSAGIPARFQDDDLDANEDVSPAYQDMVAEIDQNLNLAQHLPPGDLGVQLIDLETEISPDHFTLRDRLVAHFSYISDSGSLTWARRTEVEIDDE
jgi:hypothetical protein